MQSLIATNSSSMSATFHGDRYGLARKMALEEPRPAQKRTPRSDMAIPRQPCPLTPARRMQQLLRQRPVCFRQNLRLPRAGWRGIAGPLPKWEAVLAATAAASAALGITAWLQQSRLISDERPSLAVLPFNNLGGDAKWDSRTVGRHHQRSLPRAKSPSWSRAPLRSIMSHGPGPQKSAGSLA